jgi:hypothetical protein
LSQCPTCGRELPEGALYCPDCGAGPIDYSIAQSDVSPSHFNSGMTATSQPQTTIPTDDAEFAVPPPPFPEEKNQSSSSSSSFFRRRGLALTIIIALVILLVGVAFEAGLLGMQAGTGHAINSASTPFTGQQLYAAYSANQSQADASYNNKTVYIQDSLDFGVGIDSGGNYFSTVNSGSVILIWSDLAQVGQLSQGEMVLAKCSVVGLQSSPLGGGLSLYLQNCDLISVQSQTATINTQSISVANL